MNKKKTFPFFKTFLKIEQKERKEKLAHFLLFSSSWKRSFLRDPLSKCQKSFQALQNLIISTSLFSHTHTHIQIKTPPFVVQ
jgi:hypothetical protein